MIPSAALVLAGAIQIEASRPDGTIGRWVVFALLATVAVLWVTLVAVVVRIRLHMSVDRAAVSSVVEQGLSSGSSTGREAADREPEPRRA